MLIFDNNISVKTTYERAVALSISKEFAEHLNGRVNVVNHQGSEQENRRRELLSVEVEAQQEKIIAAHGEEHFRKQVMNEFTNQVKNKLDNDFDKKDFLYHEVLAFEDTAPQMLDTLSTRAASVNQVKPLANQLSWLCDDLINLVNKPQYRKRADVQVNDAMLALSYIGLDNLKLVIPTFILKHWLPSNTSPFALMKRKLWNDSLSIALAAGVLAKQQELDWFTAFTTGMLSNIGKLGVTQCVFTSVNNKHKNEVRAAFEAKDKRLHNILQGLGVSETLLLEQLLLRSAPLSADLVEQMNFQRLAITEPIFDLAYATHITKMCPIAKVVAKAKAYVAFRSLSKDGLISAEESKGLLSSVNFKAAEITLLKKSDIDHIKLNFN